MATKLFYQIDNAWRFATSFASRILRARSRRVYIWPTVLASAIGVRLLGAEPTSKPSTFDAKTYAMAIAQVYSNEDELVRDASDKTAPPLYRRYAMQAAIMNEWGGPFRLGDLARWLQETRLGEQISIASVEWDSGPLFKHLTAGMRPLSINLGKGNDPILVFAVDEKMIDTHVSAILQNPPKVVRDDDPIVYAVRPVDIPIEFYMQKAIK
jgi:hypothetical protein